MLAKIAIIAIIVILVSIILVLTVLYAEAKSDADIYKDLYNNSKLLRSEMFKQQSLRFQKYEANIFVPGVLDALKYARKRSHPDNGGSNQEFKKYNKIYEDFLKKTNLY